jgi:hypothetical protein
MGVLAGASRNSARNYSRQASFRADPPRIMDGGFRADFSDSSDGPHPTGLLPVGSGGYAGLYDGHKCISPANPGCNKFRVFLVLGMTGRRYPASVRDTVPRRNTRRGAQRTGLIAFLRGQ